MYTQTNVGLLCCVGSGSNVAVPLKYILTHWLRTVQMVHVTSVGMLAAAEI
jgi:hypothetical protein